MSHKYDVGYKKPPKNSQFRPGQSGNPKGRPRGVKNFRTDLREELAESIPLREQGKLRKVTKQRAVLKSLTLKAIQGDVRASNLLVNAIANFLNETETAETDDPFTDDELAILETLSARLSEPRPCPPNTPNTKKKNGPVPTRKKSKRRRVRLKPDVD